METTHRSTPEPIVFLRLAAVAMSEYKESNGCYPKGWIELGMTFANGPYHLSDPDVRPTEESRLVWRPRKAEYRYKIESAGDAERFLLSALKDDGTVEYTMSEHDSLPVALPSSAH